MSVGACITVPFLDLAPIHRSLKSQILDDVAALIDSGAFTNGAAVGRFERAYAAYCGVDYCVGVGSGLDALRLSLLAAGLEPGDEVIVPAATFVATLEAVTQAGGRPVLVDVSAGDYAVDVGAVRAAAGPRTAFVMPVHLYGQLADMRALRAFSSTTGVAIVEDACQAHGATRDDVVAGGGGLAAAFSFYPGKNLGAFGDAGCVTTHSSDVAARVCALREHGQVAKYEHRIEGYTSRLDTLQASVLLHKLALLDEWNEQRRAAAAYYDEALEGVGDLVPPPRAPNSQPVWHLYVVRTSAVVRLEKHLRASGVATGRHYPTPTHLTEAYAWLGYRRGSFPVAEALSRHGLSLPLYPGITEAQLATVVDAVRRFFDDGA